jgi:hypothetical protein
MFGISKIYLILAFLGMFIHILMKVLNRKDKTKKLSFKVFFSNSSNWIRMILAVVSTIAILLMSSDIADILNIKLSDGSPGKSLLAFMAGYLNHSIIRNLLSTFEKKNKE